MRYVQVDYLMEGDVVATALHGEHNIILINSGKSLTNELIKKIKNLGFDGLYIEDDLSENVVIEEAIPPTLKAKIIKNLKKLNIDNALSDAKEIVKNLQITNSFYEYINSKTFDNYTYEHSLNVSVYATIIGIACGYNKVELENLSTAGLLHDIGKRCIDENIVNKPAKLTKEEYEEIQKHSEYGYNLLKDNFDISSTAKMGVYEHHENEDGSGYPRHIKSKDIYKFAKIIHVVDVYDALISKRPYKEAKSPIVALEFLEQHKGSMFDATYVDIFLNIVPAYPKGIIVKLTNGEMGIVMENYKFNVLRPKLRLLNKKEVSLKDDEDYKDVAIESIYYPTKEECKKK